MSRPGGGVPSPATLRSALRTSTTQELRDDDPVEGCRSDGCPPDGASPTCTPAASSPRPHRRSWQGGVQESESPRPARTSTSGGVPMSPVSWGKSISRRLSTALMRLGSGLGLKTSTSEPVMNTNVEVIASDDDKSPVSRRVADWAKQKASSRRLALTKTSIIVHRHHFERCPPSGRLNATFKLGSLDGRSSALTAELDAQSPPGNSGRTSPLPVLVRVGTQPRDGRESPFLPARHSYNGWASDAEDNAMARGRPGSGDHALPMIGSSAPATPGSPGSSPGGGFVQRGPSLQRPRSPSQPGSLPTLPAGRALSRVQGESRLGKAASSRIHPSMSVPLPVDGGS